MLNLLLRGLGDKPAGLQAARQGEKSLAKGSTET